MIYCSGKEVLQRLLTSDGVKRYSRALAFGFSYGFAERNRLTYGVPLNLVDSVRFKLGFELTKRHTDIADMEHRRPDGLEMRQSGV